jgi:hypothetical protein
MSKFKGEKRREIKEKTLIMKKMIEVLSPGDFCNETCDKTA